MNAQSPDLRHPLAHRGPLIALAWLNVVLHVVALVLADQAIRPGSPLVSLQSRLLHLGLHPIGWTFAWASWMCCAAALIAFLAVLSQRLRTPLAQFALMFAVAGAAFDIFCDAVYMLVLPPLAARHAEDPSLVGIFLVVERVTEIGSMTIANGAYSVAILLLNVDMRRRVSRFTFGLGYGVAGCGFLLAAAGITGVPWHAEWATPPTIGLFCLWAVLVAHATTGERGALAP